MFREELKTKDCPFIGKYYYLSKNIKPDLNGSIENWKFDNSNSLFMEFYSYKSLDQFKILYSPTISLNTKIFILYQASQGVKFLKDNQIYHLDLKPGNILVNIFIF